MKRVSSFLGSPLTLVATVWFACTPPTMAASYTLTISTNGSGAVTRDPVAESYPSNSIVRITGLPAAGWAFAHWSGDINFVENPIDLVMKSNMVITANFAQMPMIDVPPQNAVVPVGATTNFTVHAVGAAPLAYQWWFNGVPLAGATTTKLTLSNIQPIQEGPYSVTVMNAYGAATNSAQLILTDACPGTNVVSTPSEAALRNAIQLGGVVSLCFNGTITLSNTIAITNNVALDARNRSIVISGNNAVRLFSVNSGVTFSATNLTLANGRHIGANGADAIAFTQPPQNGLAGEGGAILNLGGTVQLSGCTLVSNMVMGGMGGRGAQPYPTNGAAGEGRGGAILVRGGSLLLDSVTVSDSSATGGPGLLIIAGLPREIAGHARGGAIYVTNGSLLVANGNLRSNVCMALHGGEGPAGANARGGAIFLSAGELTLTNCAVVGNSAIGESGSLGDPAGASAYGGAVAVDSATILLTRCEFNDNLALGGSRRSSLSGEAQGGALHASGTLVARQISFYQNLAFASGGSGVNAETRGGACYIAGSASFDQSSFVANEARGGNARTTGPPGGPQQFPGGHAVGGAVYNAASPLTMTNCTVALNSTLGGSGLNNDGAGGGAWGGGVYNRGTFFAAFVTMASNSVAVAPLTNGLAGGANVVNTNGSVTLYGSILAYPGSSSNASGTITDAGFNLSSDGSASFTSGTSSNSTDPLLQAPAFNGGPTLTMALLPGSPAINVGSIASAPPTDQRGLPRPFGSGVDIGAYEAQGRATQGPVLHVLKQLGGVQVSFQAESNVFYSLQRSTALPANWTEFEPIGPYPFNTNVQRFISINGEPKSFFRLFSP